MQYVHTFSFVFLWCFTYLENIWKIGPPVPPNNVSVTDFDDFFQLAKLLLDQVCPKNITRSIFIL